jgi:hypothetical protein
LYNLLSFFVENATQTEDKEEAKKTVIEIRDILRTA